MEIIDQMNALIAENSALTPEDVGGSADDLFAAGLSSLDCVRILLAIEDEFEIELDQEIINRELFSSVEKLCAAVSDAIGASA